MRPLTIIHTEASLGWGGQEIRIYTEMKAMRSRGHMLLLAAQPESEILRRAKKEGFTVFPFSQRGLLFPYSIIRLACWFKKSGADIVNTHSSKDGWIGGIAARLAGVPCLIRSKHIDVDYPRKFFSRIAYGILPHHVLTTSEQIKRKLCHQLNLEAGHITTLATGIDPTLFHDVEPSKLRKELGIEEATPLIGMISVIRSWKGHRYFLEAADQLIAHNPDLKFIIVGDGPGFESLVQTNKDRGLENKIICLGHRQDVPQLLKTLDLLVLSSTAHEGIPQIILQAQMARCAVVATTVGGIPEVVQHGVTGRLVSPAQADELALAIKSALREKEKTSEMINKAYAQAMRDHTMEVMCERTEKIYNQIL